MPPKRGEDNTIPVVFGFVLPVLCLLMTAKSHEGWDNHGGMG